MVSELYTSTARPVGMISGSQRRATLVRFGWLLVRTSHQSQPVKAPAAMVQITAQRADIVVSAVRS